MKKNKTIILFKKKHFMVVSLVMRYCLKKFSFWRHIITIIKPVILRKLLYYESLVDIEVSSNKTSYHWQVL